MSQKLHENCTWGIVLTLIGVLLFLTGQPSPVSAQSANVVIIGGTTLDCYDYYNGANYIRSGGCLPVTGTDLSGINFTPMAASAVSAASLAPYDTAVLNMASYRMACNANNLTLQAKQDLIDFVELGNKLIIYDSECPSVNYSWLPFPFTTNNPGQMGAHGTLTVVEDNTLSGTVGDPWCTGGDPYCINVNLLGTSTDAVGDMNVMVTMDPNWCLDMTGTNITPVTGPVHTYADYPPNTDRGLIIYNGLDMDYMDYYGGSGGAELRKIWVQELKQPFNPSGLPCFGTVVGIKLDPETATNPVGTTHTVTARLTDMLGNPQMGILVTFAVVSGPNVGATGTCSANADCTTDANGEVSFTYTSDGTVGVDEIVAEFTDDTGQVITSNTAEKEWGSICGDLDGDGDVDYDDYWLFLGAYGTSAGDPGFIADADYDGDGIVALPDFYTWYNCYWDYVTS